MPDGPPTSKITKEGHAGMDTTKDITESVQTVAGVQEGMKGINLQKPLLQPNPYLGTT